MLQRAQLQCRNDPAEDDTQCPNIHLRVECPVGLKELLRRHENLCALRPLLDYALVGLLQAHQTEVDETDARIWILRFEQHVLRLQVAMCDGRVHLVEVLQGIRHLPEVAPQPLVALHSHLAGFLPADRIQEVLERAAVAQLLHEVDATSRLEPLPHTDDERVVENHKRLELAPHELLLLRIPPEAMPDRSPFDELHSHLLWLGSRHGPLTPHFRNAPIESLAEQHRILIEVVYRPRAPSDLVQPKKRLHPLWCTRMAELTSNLVPQILVLPSCAGLRPRD
mmetsp:Transcript_161789/g.518985  ORF Transcript_161789/g.518985 Transcript_161789/m.518985 type:complete len:281 (-) Transcript_161789:122-964(-)